jgi:hypothetical protein
MAKAQLKTKKQPTDGKHGGNRGGLRTRLAKVKKRSAQAAGKDPHRNAKTAVRGR